MGVVTTIKSCTTSVFTTIYNTTTETKEAFSTPMNATTINNFTTILKEFPSNINNLLWFTFCAIFFMACFLVAAWVRNEVMKIVEKRAIFSEDARKEFYCGDEKAEVKPVENRPTPLSAVVIDVYCVYLAEPRSM